MGQKLITEFGLQWGFWSLLPLAIILSIEEVKVNLYKTI